MMVPERYVLVLVCFLAAATCYLDRVGFPLAYTAMAQARRFGSLRTSTLG
jgi:hypothetical protein